MRDGVKLTEAEQKELFKVTNDYEKARNEWRTLDAEQLFKDGWSIVLNGHTGELHLAKQTEQQGVTVTDLEGNVIKPFGTREDSIWDLARAGRNEELYAQLEKNPGLIWRFDIGTSDEEFAPNKDYVGHDILNAIFPKVYESVTSRKQVVDEYGYSFNMPAWSPNDDFTGWGRTVLEYGQSDMIYSEDKLVWLSGLTLEERDVFYSEFQKIFDEIGLDLDARKQWYISYPTITQGDDGKPLSEECQRPASWRFMPDSDKKTATVQEIQERMLSNSFLLAENPSIGRETIRQIDDMMLANPVLAALAAKAEKVQNGTIADDTLAQQYSIRVTDNEGNRLANDRIIVESRNGNQIEMSVEQFSEMSRMDITKLLR
jgi:hypothetical protein